MSSIKGALSSARQLHRSGGGAVLDILRRQSPLPLDEFASTLERETGIRAIFEAGTLRPDFVLQPQADAVAHGWLALRSADDARVIAGMLDPWDEQAVQRAATRLGSVPELVVLSAAVFRGWLGAAAVEPGVAAGDVAAASGGRDEQGAVPSGPVVDFVDAAIRGAFEQGASDIHFECNRAGVVVKLRLDGVMVPLMRLDNPARAQEVISRIKVLAQLDITERRIPQDGRFRYHERELRSGGTGIDLRVSIMPSVFGEDAVLRLLDKAQLRATESQVSLEILGFDADSAARIRELAELPHGMLLVTGPTGSGKTTTVYASLSEVNTGLEKIVTIEDPVEYELPGVLQIPVNEKKGLTFARGLRSILRHDPDRILVGEIRDAETAEIAVQSALTGHQVFTTVHANSIYDVTGRFRHFGIDMFGFMSALNGVVVQRLVRRLCGDCAGERAVLSGEARWLAGHDVQQATLPLAVGCPLCKGTGYRGRLVIAEVHALDDGFRDLVIRQSPVSELRAHVRAAGTPSLGRLAAGLIGQRQTSFEEVKRVVGLA